MSVVARLPTAFAMVVLAVGTAEAAERCEPATGRVSSIEGQVEVQPSGASTWVRVELNGALCQGDTLRTGRRSRAAILLVNDAVFRLDENTTLRLVDISPKVEQRSLLGLVQGAIQSFSRAPRRHEINTAYLNAIIEGTEFVARVEADRALIDLSEGRIVGTNERGRIELAQGQAVTARAGQAPQARVEARPMEAVQWALHYPPLLAAGRAGDAQTGVSRALTEALARAGRNDANGALEALERMPAPERTAPYFLYRAAILLSVGRVTEARGDIDAALARDAKAGLAFALRAVIGVVQNDKAQALADATRAVEAAPREAAAKIALSYALQAHYRLEEARDALAQAVAEQPNDALAMARLSELWLMLGYRDRAVGLAQQAAAASPDLGRVQVVLGFAALTQFRTGVAREAFGRAIQLDSADPLPHLGLGLAKIRDGSLEDGRKDIEVAVGLDARNALLRAYLGKAYFEEKRGPLDAQQYEISKRLDPNDPTPYLYDAIRKQSEGRPGEALTDIQGSIARNDNRAVYRGRLQLDQDLAARGTSLGRIHDDLGFYQAGANEASRSLSLDPSNASAHRFLSDVYKGVPRRDIARVSELLQAQLLQNVNINPVQPSLSETSLGIASFGGPADPGFNEFTSLFQRNKIQLNATAMAGNHGTRGGEAVVSGLYDWISVSAGTYKFDTDGFRQNFGIEHEIHNFFAQAALTPEINAQIELRRRETTEGDLDFNFDPTVFVPDRKRKLDHDIGRIGLRYSPDPGSHFLLSAIRSGRDELETFTDPGLGPVLASTTEYGYQVEGQHIFQRGWLNLVTGGGFSDVDSKQSVLLPAFGGAFDQFLTPDIWHPRGYVYANVNWPQPVTWTFGASYDNYKEKGGTNFDEFSPKFGVEWNVTDRLRLRGAWFKVVKPALVNNRTIEPTQIAGFNQFFDDSNATVTNRAGVGVDWRIRDNILVGAEASGRDLDVPAPIPGATGFVFEDQDERLYRAYIYWTPISEVALSLEVIRDHFMAPPGDATDFSSIPLELKTISVPVGVRYFHPQGFFAGLKATYVNQDVERSLIAPFPQGSDSFVVVDAALGYRLPSRMGSASIEVRNLFDQKFKYQDDNFRNISDEPSVPAYIPDRAVVARVTLNW